MDFIRDFEDRVNEVNKYFEFVLIIENLNKIENLESLKKYSLIINHKKKYPIKKSIDSSGSYAINLDLRKVLKATAFLILYNLVEGSVTSALNEYFNSFSSKRQKYKDFKPFIKTAWIKYKYKRFENHKPEDIVTLIENLFEEIIEIIPKEIRDRQNNTSTFIYDYNAYISEIGKSEISGNIDARKIRELSALYGFGLPTQDQCDSLVKIKNNRNKLAHGENTFTDIGRESIEDLIFIKDESVGFLRSVLKKINKSIVKEIYKK